MNIISKRKIISIVFLFCFNTFAMADEFHYNNLLIGDRASGMGGAYTAISDDASGMYYNPAGIIYVTDKNFSASVNAYSSQTKQYDNVIGGQPFTRKSSALLANYFGIIKPMGDYKIGFSYAVPDAVNEDLSQSVANVPAKSTLSPSLTALDYTLNLNNRDNTYNLGPSFAAAVNNDLSLGLTLYVHQRDTLIIQNQFLAMNDGKNQWTNSYYKLNETGLKPILGVTWAPVERLSLGLSLSKTYLISSNATWQVTCADSTATGCDASVTPAIPYKVPAFTNSDAKRNYPLRVAFGAAYFASSDLLLSTDVTYHTAVENQYPFDNRVSTVDVALGTEYYVAKKWAVRAGLFTNVANTTPIQAGVTNIEEHINIFGASLSLTHFTGDTSVTIGGSLSSGRGQSQITGDINNVQDASTFGWTMFLSSSY